MVRKGIFNLSGKVALVTGGGSGLGQAYCEAVAEFGADVACVDIVEQKARQTVELISRHGHRAIAIKANVSEQGEIKSMVDRTVKELGTIDIVFANAGVGDKDMVKIHQARVEDWDRVFSLQPRGVFLLMQAAFPIMMKQKAGCFITTASIGGLWPIPPGELFYYPVAYNTAKAGVIMLTKLAARQYGEFGIRVNAICPGYHRTSLLPEEFRPRVEEAILSLTPLKRVGLPKDIKGLAVWLASDASSFVTGQAFIEDGGMIA